MAAKKKSAPKSAVKAKKSTKTTKGKTGQAARPTVRVIRPMGMQARGR